jgi:hypothetical protein
MVGDIGVNAILIIGSISDDRGQRAGDLIEQPANLRRIVHPFVGQRFSNDLAGAGIYTEVKLPPRPARLGAMLFDQPLARARTASGRCCLSVSAGAALSPAAVLLNCGRGTANVAERPLSVVRSGTRNVRPSRLMIEPIRPSACR